MSWKMQYKATVMVFFSSEEKLRSISTGLPRSVSGTETQSIYSCSLRGIVRFKPYLIHLGLSYKQSDWGRDGKWTHGHSVGLLLSWSLLPLFLVTTLLRKCSPQSFQNHASHSQGLWPTTWEMPLPSEPCCHLLAANHSLTSRIPPGSQDLTFICKGGSLGPPLIKLQLQETDHLYQIQPHGFLLC